MSAPADQRVRELALDATQSFIVQAPAGSGKTELLTRRVLTLLTTVNEPEEILAITFTRKAASEMRQRVIETLQQAATAGAPDTAYELQGWRLARKVIERDEQRNWQLMRNPQRLNLRTIDSLATRLAHSLPVTSTLGAPTGMVENADTLYREAAQRFIESNLESLDRVLLHLGNRLDRAQFLLAGLLSRRDQWQRHVYNAGDDHAQLRQVLESMLAELIESRLQNLARLQPLNLEHALLPCLRKAAEFALQAAEGDIDELGWEMQLWYTMECLPGCEAEDLNAWASVAHALLTTQDGVRKQVTVREGFPSKANAKQFGVSAAELDSHKQDMKDVLALVADSPEFIEALVEVRKLPPPAYKDEQWELLSQLLTVLPDLLIELQLVFAEHALVDFGEIAARASLSLGTEQAPTDLALSMDLSLRHLLVDEFQDTSHTQFRLFTQLVRPWEPGDGRTFFAVGDPMQSIYRFREGDVALFAQVQAQGIGPVDVTPLTLSVNFRASPTVTDWVNRTFARIFPAQADTDIGAVPYSPSEAFRTDTGAVKVHPLIDADRQSEADCVAQLCRTAIRDDPEHQVAILVRSRTQATAIFAALREQSLAYDSVDMDLVGERLVVRDLISIVLALRFPHDRLHWLSLLRAPFVGLSLHDLHVLMGDAERPVAVIERLQDASVVSALSSDAQLRVKRLLAVVEPAMKRAMRTRLMPWVESVWLQLGGPAVCQQDMDYDAAERALASLYQLESRGELWRKSSIEAAMANLYAVAADTEDCQIQVMTLHKSKGLEFDTVILPALDRRSGTDGTQLLNWFESTLDGKPQLLLAPFEQTGIQTYQRDPLNKLVQRAQERCNAQETLRLLYVACTRARRYLHLVACASHNASGELAPPVKASLLAPLWPVLEQDFQAARPKAADQDDKPAAQLDADDSRASAQPGPDAAEPAQTVLSLDDAATPVPFLRIATDAQLPAFNRFTWPVAPAKTPVEERHDTEYSWAGRLARDIGTVIHDQLQMMADPPADSVLADPVAQEAVIRRQLQNLGVGDSDLDGAVDRVVKALDNTLADQRGRWILAAHRQARTEWALSVPLDTQVLSAAAGGERLRTSPVEKVVIDRSFVDDSGTRWIIDYKTGDHEGGSLKTFLDNEQARYANQLNRYADIIRRMDHRPVRVGLYFPMLKSWREWEPALL